MSDTEIIAILNNLEGRIYQLEQKIENMADVGDVVEAEWHLYGDVYETRNVEIKRILKR